MLKTIITRFRGSTARAAEELADRNALLILDQQIRDSAASLDRARRALAIAIAQDSGEARRIADIKARVADLESRAIAALDGSREDLAAEAAEAIAGLEADLAAAQAAHAGFARESGKLRRLVKNAEHRFGELERGRRTAQAGEAVRRLRTTGAAEIGNDASALRDAEATLARLRRQQTESEIADAAFDDLDGARGPERVSEKLEAAGFGEPTKSTPASVLERLKQARKPAPAPTA